MSDSVNEKELLKQFEKMLIDGSDDEDFLGSFYIDPIRISRIDTETNPKSERASDTSEPPPTPKQKCEHKKKYINKYMSQHFWVCPDCKEDLGDV